MPLSTNPALLLDSCLHALWLDREHMSKDGLDRVSRFLSLLLSRECVGYEMHPLNWSHHGATVWLSELGFYVSGAKLGGMGYTEPFFRRTALPLRQATEILNTAERPDRRDAALAVVGRMAETEWRTAMVLWIEQQYGASNVVQRVTISGSAGAGVNESDVGRGPDVAATSEQWVGAQYSDGFSFPRTGGKIP